MSMVTKLAMFPETHLLLSNDSHRTLSVSHFDELCSLCPKCMNIKLDSHGLVCFDIGFDMTLGQHI